MVTTVNKSLSQRRLNRHKDEVPMCRIPHEEFKEGWLSCDQYVPEKYELVSLKTDFFSQSISAWRNGSTWVGLRVRDKRKYSYWKFVEEEE